MGLENARGLRNRGLAGREDRDRLGGAGLRGFTGVGVLRSALGDRGWFLSTGVGSMRRMGVLGVTLTVRRGRQSPVRGRVLGVAGSGLAACC